MKKNILSIILLLTLTLIYSTSYKITDVEYSISGITTKSSLKQKIPVDTNTIFSSKEDLERYLQDLQKQLQNNRIFTSAKVSIISLSSSENFDEVSILIETKDSWNIIGLPYPSYDSNTGLKFKLKLKDYNFLGSMEVFDSTLNYVFEEEKNNHEFDLNFTIPFPTFNLLTLTSNANADFNLAYSIGDDYVKFKTSQTIIFSKDINDVMAFSLGLKNTFFINPDYIENNDIFYFNEKIEFSTPIKLAKIENVGNLLWTPKFSFAFNWDFDAFEGIANNGLLSSELHGSVISLGQSINIARINWYNNFRNGFSFNVTQNVDFNLLLRNIFPQYAVNTEFHKKINDNFGISTRQQLFFNINENLSEKGDLLRGIKNNLFKTSSGIILNFDLPIKIVQTDWVTFFNNFNLSWNWTKMFDFEFQISPFFDMALCRNEHTNTHYLIEDGYFSNGLEILVYPNIMKSIVGRISLGFDTVKLLQKFGENNKKLDNFTNNLFNTTWRKGENWELYIGIGLFY